MCNFLIINLFFFRIICQKYYSLLKFKLLYNGKSYLVHNKVSDVKAIQLNECIF